MIHTMAISAQLHFLFCGRLNMVNSKQSRASVYSVVSPGHWATEKSDVKRVPSLRRSSKHKGRAMVLGSSKWRLALPIFLVHGQHFYPCDNP